MATCKVTKRSKILHSPTNPSSQANNLLATSKPHLPHPAQNIHLNNCRRLSDNQVKQSAKLHTQRYIPNPQFCPEKCLSHHQPYTTISSQTNPPPVNLSSRKEIKFLVLQTASLHPISSRRRPKPQTIFICHHPPAPSTHQSNNNFFFLKKQATINSLILRTPKISIHPRYFPMINKRQLSNFTTQHRDNFIQPRIMNIHPTNILLLKLTLNLT